MHFISRISYNTSGWQHPTGEAGTLEGKKSFHALHGFGFEDWLFRGDWLLDGWRYAFIQGANKQGRKYEGSYPVIPHTPVCGSVEATWTN